MRSFLFFSALFVLSVNSELVSDQEFNDTERIAQFKELLGIPLPTLKIPDFLNPAPANNPQIKIALLTDKRSNIALPTLPNLLPTALPTINIPTIKLPDLIPTALPTIKIPDIIPTIPKIDLPTLPPIKIPDIIPTALPTLPPIKIPDIVPTIPKIDLPTLPPINIPDIIPTIPKIDLPTLPPIKIPDIIPTIPQINLPTLPPIKIPDIIPTALPKIPTINLPTLPHLLPTAFPTLFPRPFPLPQKATPNTPYTLPYPLPNNDTQSNTNLVCDLCENAVTVVKSRFQLVEKTVRNQLGVILSNVCGIVGKFEPLAILAAPCNMFKSNLVDYAFKKLDDWEATVTPKSVCRIIPFCK